MGIFFFFFFLQVTEILFHSSILSESTVSGLWLTLSVYNSVHECFLQKGRAEVHETLSSRVPMLTLVEEERFMLTLVAERSMISLVVEDPC